MSLTENRTVEEMIKRHDELYNEYDTYINILELRESAVPGPGATMYEMKLFKMDYSEYLSEHVKNLSSYEARDIVRLYNEYEQILESLHKTNPDEYRNPFKKILKMHKDY